MQLQLWLQLWQQYQVIYKYTKRFKPHCIHETRSVYVQHFSDGEATAADEATSAAAPTAG